ncbi:hypothetical protein TNCV_4023931 [Trichonephila clavipes]|nr:hypothetical protein TNCV_4023931 [Trichonephila clavipes]
MQNWVFVTKRCEGSAYQAHISSLCGWIERDGPVSWPSRNQDLNPWISSFAGYHKSLVFEMWVPTVYNSNTPPAGRMRPT